MEFPFQLFQRPSSKVFATNAKGNSKGNGKSGQNQNERCIYQLLRNPKLAQDQKSANGVDVYKRQAVHCSGSVYFSLLPDIYRHAVELRSIIREMCIRDRCYAVWNDMRDQLEGYYKTTPRQHAPLSHQREFRAIKNQIIREAERLRSSTAADLSLIHILPWFACMGRRICRFRLQGGGRKGAGGGADFPAER